MDSFWYLITVYVIKFGAISPCSRYQVWKKSGYFASNRKVQKNRNNGSCLNTNIILAIISLYIKTRGITDCAKETVRHAMLLGKFEER